MVDLSQHLNQTVKVMYRNGNTDTVVIEDNGDGDYDYPCVIEGMTYTKNGLFYDDHINEHDIVKITPINQNSTSNNNQMNIKDRPVTISDFIQLLTAAKEKYGDLNVLHVRDGDNVEDAVEFEDVIVTGGTTSLIRNRNIDNEKSQLVFIVQ
jgi:hypothetical protein